MRVLSDLKGEKGKKLVKKVLLTLIGVLFMGITLSVLKIIDWGLDSYTYMNTSIAEKIGWTFGNWQLLLNVFLFIPIILWGRKYLGIGTIFNMVLVGYTWISAHGSGIRPDWSICRKHCGCACQ